MKHLLAMASALALSLAAAEGAVAQVEVQAPPTGWRAKREPRYSATPDKAFGSRVARRRKKAKAASQARSAQRKAGKR